MVSGLHHAWILVAEAEQAVIEKLDPERRAAVILALIGLALLGVLLVVLVMLGGRWARRGVKLRPDRSKPPQEKDKSASFRSAETLVDTYGQPGETQSSSRIAGETIVDD